MEKEIVLKLPLCTNNLLCARLTSSAVASLMNINIDDAEDIKICVNEACLILMTGNFSTAEIRFDMSDDLSIEITGSGQCSGDSVYEGSPEISIMLLNSLLDEARYIKNGEVISKIMLLKRI